MRSRLNGRLLIINGGFNSVNRDSIKEIIGKGDSAHLTKIESRKTNERTYMQKSH